MRLRRPVAPEGRPQLLHDRLGRAREQRGCRPGAAPHRPGPPPLPLGSVLSRTRRPDRAGRRAGRDVRDHGRERRADRRRAPQGVRTPRPGRHSRRPRRSPRTSRARSGWRSRSTAPASSAFGRTWPADAVVVCSFGDASLNHAAAQAALNTTAHAAYQRLPVPLLYVCEDNGLGISVPTPSGWVAEVLAGRSDLRYESADGDDPEGDARSRTAADGLGAEHEATGRAPPPYRPLPRPCRRRRGNRVSRAPRRSCRPRPRPVAGHGDVARRDRRPEPRATRRRVSGDAGTRARGRACRSPTASAPERRGGDAPARAPLERGGSRAGTLGRRGRGTAHARARDQRGPRRGPRPPPGDTPVRRGRRSQRRRVRRHAWAPRALRGGPRLRHAARRDLDPRPRPGGSRDRVRPARGDPVPRVPPQRRGPAPRRSRDPAVLLAGSIPQRHGRTNPRVRLSEGLRRPFPQRRLGRGPPRHPRARDRLPVTAGRCSGDATNLRRRGPGRRQRLRLPRADCALPHA